MVSSAGVEGAARSIVQFKFTFANSIDIIFHLQNTNFYFHSVRLSVKCVETLNWDSWISATFTFPISHSNRAKKKKWRCESKPLPLSIWSKSNVLFICYQFTSGSVPFLWSSFFEHTIMRWAFQLIELFRLRNCRLYDWRRHRLLTIRPKIMQIYTGKSGNEALSPIDLSESGRNQLLKFQHFNIDILYVFRLIKLLVSNYFVMPAVLRAWAVWHRLIKSEWPLNYST